MSAYWKLLDEIEEAYNDDFWDLDDKLNSISSQLEQEIKNILIESNEIALEKLLYLSFRVPFIVDHSAFNWYPQLLNKTIRRLKKGAYRNNLRSVLRNLSEGIKDDKSLAKKVGRSEDKKGDIIRFIQFNIFKWAGVNVPSDLTQLYRAKKRLEKKLYPSCNDYDLSYKYEINHDKDGVSYFDIVGFEKAEDEFLYGIYHWLEVGLMLEHLTPDDIDNVMSIFHHENSEDAEINENSYEIPEDKFKETRKMIKIHLENNF